VALAACGGLEPDPSLQMRVTSQLAAKLRPVRPNVLAMWHAGDEPSSFVCGEIEAPPRLRAKQATTRFITLPGDVVIEPHLIARDTLGAQIAAESEAIFASTWADHCAPNAPFGRRMTGWFAGHEDADAADTPITNAAGQALVERARR
jgi:hypothetical protein